jgi:N-acetylmuramoyl-L-alanine amidase
MRFCGPLLLGLLLSSSAWAAPSSLADAPPLTVQSGQIVEVVRNRATLRSGPTTDDERLTPAPSGTRFEVIGREGDWRRVRSSADSSWAAWINAADVKSLDAGSSLLPSRLRQIRMTDQPAGQTEIRLRLGTPCAWQIEEHPAPIGQLSHLSIELPGARSTVLEMTYPQDGKRVQDLQIHPHPGGVRLELAVNQGLWGYQSAWDKDELVLTLAAPLKADAEHPLRGVRIVVDPGHGGSDTGATGKGGTFEKALNLACGLALQKELTDAGAMVTMTRQDDHEVFLRDDKAAKKVSADLELQARVDLAESSGGQLFASIHHNASPDLVAGMTAHGTHVYYFTPHSHQLAESLASPVAHAIGEAAYHAVWRSFHVIRQTSMPAVLVEVDFLSNPTLEQNVETRPGYAQSVGRALRQGLEDFVRSNGTVGR